jgi:large subunit ribosomal protein L18
MKHLIKKSDGDAAAPPHPRRLSGTAARPRARIHRTQLQIYAQVVDDSRASRSARVSLDLRKGSLGDAKGGGISGAKAVGAEIARRAKDERVCRVAFDRAGYRLPRRVQALASGREAGLKF